MSLRNEFEAFLDEIWSDAPEITENKIDIIGRGYDFMFQVNGKPPLKFVAGVYDLITGDEQSAVFSHRYESMYPRIIDSGAWVCSALEDKKTVLDLGCNTAHNLIWWAEKFPKSKFTGIEISEKSLSVANQWKNKRSINNLVLVKGDILDKNEALDDFKFDIIINSYSLETIPDLEESNWQIPEWIIESSATNAKIIACLTVPEWQRLELIINTWRGQGFALRFLDLFPNSAGSAHPHLIMEKNAEDIDIDIVGLMETRVDELFN